MDGSLFDRDVNTLIFVDVFVVVEKDVFALVFNYAKNIF